MLDLNKPTANDLLKFRNDPELIKSSNRAINSLRELASIITPLTIAAIAQQLYPSESLGMAVAKLDIQIQQVRAGIVSHAAQAGDVSETERARLAPVLGTATRRVFAIYERIAQIGAAIPRATQDNELRRAKMQDAQMSPAEIDSIAPPVADTSGLSADLELLNVELNILNAFIETGDESCLPDGFVAVSVPKITIPLDKNVTDFLDEQKAA